MQKKLVPFDTETTGLENGRVIELAYAEMDSYESGDTPTIVCFRAKNPCPIDLEALAVHHITESSIINFPYFVDRPEYPEAKRVLESGIAIAHKAEFDVEVLSRDGIDISNFIDTKRLAKHLYPEAKKHSLQYLRYFLGVHLPPTLIPHTADADVLVLIAVFRKLMWKIEEGLLEGEDAIEKALRLTKEPVILRVLDWGSKHRGETFQEINRNDRSYLEWMLGKDDLDEDIKHTVRYWIGRKSL